MERALRQKLEDQLASLREEIAQKRQEDYDSRASDFAAFEV